MDRSRGQLRDPFDSGRPRVGLEQAAAVGVGDPDRALAERDALRASEAGEVADDLIGGWIDLRHRAALVALVIVASPDEPSSNGDLGLEVDRTRRDPRADPSRASIDPDEASVELGRPYRAGADCEIPPIGWQAGWRPDQPVRAGSMRETVHGLGRARHRAAAEDPDGSLARRHPKGCSIGMWTPIEGSPLDVVTGGWPVHPTVSAARNTMTANRRHPRSGSRLNSLEPPESDAPLSGEEST
jgi:hypothetical protein